MEITLVKASSDITVKLCGSCINCIYSMDGECAVAKIAETLCRHGQKA